MPVEEGSPGVWERGWDGHRLEQQRRTAALPLWIKIDWLEETQRLLRNLGRAPGQAGPPDGG